jgi:hypothetical protein
MLYYKDDVIHRGTIVMTGAAELKRTGKDSIEIKVEGRTFYLYTDLKDMDAW